MSRNTTNQAANHSTMERVAARIPGTTEHAERHHPALGRQGRANLNTAQANAALPPNANVNPNVQTSGGAGILPATHHQQQFAAPTNTAVQPQPGYTGLPPTTGQKIIGKAQAGVGRLVGNPQMQAQGLQKASGLPVGTTATQQQLPQQQAGGYPPANF